MAGKEANNKERRQIEEEKRKDHKKVPLTLARLWEMYQTTGKPIIARADRFFWPYLAPLHERHVESLTTKDADALLRKLQSTPSKRHSGRILSAKTQEHILSLLKRLLKYADAQGLSPFPPALKITMPKVDNLKTESMTKEQMAAYWQALNEESDQVTASILRVCLLTGIRKTALFSLEWSDVDFELAQIRLRGEHAKNGKTLYVPMSQTVADVLRSVERTDSALVWPSPRTGKSRDNINNMARRVRDKAGLPKDFRPMHGLRHTFASFLASSGQVDLYTLQKLLTHQSPQMTQRYAHLADEALKRATSVTDNMIPHPTIDKTEAEGVVGNPR